MKGIILSMKENLKYVTIKKLVETNGNKKRAALKLNCSYRTVNRLIENYKKYGKSAFRHKNHDRIPSIAFDKETIACIINLYSTKYTNFNFKHFNEFLKSSENINISYNALYSILTNNGFVSPKARRSTKRKALANLDKVNKQVSDNVSIISNEIDNADAHPRLERSKNFGEVIQMDASNHLWFGDTKTHLHLAIDDSTSKIVGAYFDTQETLFGYYNVLSQTLRNYGIPYMFLTDNRTIFHYNSLRSKKLEKDTFTQFSFACSLLGTDIKTTSIPQSKGKVERSFNTHQDRLISELRISNITTIEEANNYLINHYIPKHNELFALQTNNITSVFESQPDLESINIILSVRYKRIVDKGHCIKFKNRYYQTYKDNKQVMLKPKSKCMVIKAFDGYLYLESNDIIYTLKPLNSHQKLSKNFDKDIDKVINTKDVYTPSINHPWRQSTIVLHQEKFRNKLKTLEEYFDDCVPQESI